MFRSCHLGLRMGQRAEAEAGARGEWDRDWGVRGEGAGDGGTGSRLGIVLRLHLLFVGLRVRLAKRNDAEWVFMQTSWNLSFFSAITMDSRDTQGASLCQEAASRQWPSQCHCPRSVRDHKGKPKTGREEERSLHQLHILYCKVTLMARCSRTYLDPSSCIIIALFKSQTCFISRDYCMSFVCHRIIHLNYRLDQNESH